MIQEMTFEYESTGLELVRDDIQVMLGEDELTPVYERHHASFYNTLQEDLDVSPEAYIEISECLEEMDVESAYEVLEQEVD